MFSFIPPGSGARSLSLCRPRGFACRPSLTVTHSPLFIHPFAGFLQVGAAGSPAGSQGIWESSEDNVAGGDEGKVQVLPVSLSPHWLAAAAIFVQTSRCKFTEESKQLSWPCFSCSPGSVISSCAVCCVVIRTGRSIKVIFMCACRMCQLRFYFLNSSCGTATDHKVA